MLPSRICDACREGRTDDVVSWLKKNENKENWRDNDDDYDNWIAFPAFVDVVKETINHQKLHATHTYLCMYRLGFYGHEQALEKMFKHFAIVQYNDKDTYHFFKRSLLSWFIQGVAEAGKMQLIKKLQVCHSYDFDAADVFLGGCRGNHSNMVKQFSKCHCRNVYLFDLFGVSPQCIELFVQHVSDPPYPFLYAFLTRNFEQARAIFNDFEKDSQHEFFEFCMCSAGFIGDLEMMKQMLHFFDKHCYHQKLHNEYYFVDDRVYRVIVIHKCAVQIVTYGHSHALDWIISVLPHNMVFDGSNIHPSIQCCRTDLLVKLNRGKKAHLAPEYVATYLNFGGQVQVKGRYHVDAKRSAKQRIVSSCMSFVLTDKRMVTCVVLNAISFE